ncbi:hypothetical protein PV325_001772 [Microctonus aethiopoides]|nr:hypothetical protein PV325_001772 [Microctonus aethiopoides]
MSIAICNNAIIGILWSCGTGGISANYPKLQKLGSTPRGSGGGGGGSGGSCGGSGSGGGGGSGSGGGGGGDGSGGSGTTSWCMQVLSITAQQWA